MTYSVLYSETNLVCILVLLLLSIRIKKSMFLQEQRHLLFIMMVSVMVFLLIDSLWIFINNDVINISITTNWILNGIYYIISCALGYVWFCYSEAVQKSKYGLDKKYRMIAAFPMVVITVMILLSVKTKCMFYIDGDNVYHRGSLYLIQIIVSYGYVVVTAARAFYKSFRAEDYVKKTDYRILSFYVIPSLVAGTMQFLFPDYPILSIGNTCGILFVYIKLQEQLVSIDALTKLNNRNQLFQYLSLKYTRLSNSKKTYLLLMDVDYFKSINDEYGHVEGDNALKHLANCLKRISAGKHYFIARYGGDEFILVCDIEDGERIQDVCSVIHDELEKLDTPYELSVSIGYSQYTQEVKTQQELIANADAELYKIKKHRKR